MDPYKRNSGVLAGLDDKRGNKTRENCHQLRRLLYFTLHLRGLQFYKRLTPGSK